MCHTGKFLTLVLSALFSVLKAQVLVIGQQELWTGILCELEFLLVVYLLYTIRYGQKL